VHFTDHDACMRILSLLGTPCKPQVCSEADSVISASRHSNFEHEDCTAFHPHRLSYLLSSLYYSPYPPSPPHPPRPRRTSSASPSIFFGRLLNSRCRPRRVRDFPSVHLGDTLPLLLVISKEAPVTNGPASVHHLWHVGRIETSDPFWAGE
jgi:hypothetical protein